MSSTRAPPTIVLIPFMSLSLTAVGSDMCGCEHRYDLLMTLYLGTNGSGWLNNTGWGDTTSPCASTYWYGVTCRGGDVTLITMNDNNLGGTLPDHWWNITGLQELQLYNNRISDSWGMSMSSLQYLYLHQNSISGTIPSSFGNLRGLEWFGLHTNNLTGTLPTSFANSSSLLVVHLSLNRLLGTLPHVWWKMNRLRVLLLATNNLT